MNKETKFPTIVSSKNSNSENKKEREGEWREKERVKEAQFKDSSPRHLECSELVVKMLFW